ncbi:hypothetical protein NPJ82_13600 [Sphingomonas sp. NY01]|uniref:hypothetical protein n=1 Tax=Sphingomonas sp. NY01 TaxID=2968057 RepID=UPI00315D5117
MILLAALVLLQQQPATSASSAPEKSSWSILAGCPGTQAQGQEIIVCGDRTPDRLPLPDERGPSDRPAPSNPKVDGAGALAAAATPCAASQWGCQTGVMLPIAPVIGALASAIRSAAAPKPDKSGRVAIPLEDPPLPPLQP